MLIEVRGRSHHERGRFARASGTVQRVERLSRTLLSDEEEEDVPPGCVLRPANVGMIAAAVVDEMQAMYPSRSIHLALSGYLDGQWDPDRLAEALGELVACALHGEGYGAIIVRAVGRGPDVHLMVEGSAMASSGLTEARRIVRAHGGTLSDQVCADPGKTRLLAVLPRRAR
jgi:hypothetical protein